jgi:hypothetical protein
MDEKTALHTEARARARNSVLPLFREARKPRCIGIWSATCLLVVLVVVPFLTAQKPEPSEKDKRSAQEEDIREAAFLYLFEVGTGPDPDYSFFCLSVNSDGFKDGHDPSDALMKRFPRMHRTIRKFSECEVVEKPKDLFSSVKDKKSGKSAWIISVSEISWVNDHEVRMHATRICGGLCMWSSTLQATLHEGKWQVTLPAGAYVWVS